MQKCNEHTEDFNAQLKNHTEFNASITTEMKNKFLWKAVKDGK